jgi:hypothetical protein
MSITKGGEEMPRMDKTGPMGIGPKTGRGLGQCNNEDNKTMPRFGRRKGLGRGMGRGLGRCFVANDKETLLNQKNFLEKQLEEINKELEDK